MLIIFWTVWAILVGSCLYLSWLYFFKRDRKLTAGEKALALHIHHSDKPQSFKDEW